MSGSRFTNLVQRPVLPKKTAIDIINIRCSACSLEDIILVACLPACVSVCRSALIIYTKQMYKLTHNMGDIFVRGARRLWEWAKSFEFSSWPFRSPLNPQFNPPFSSHLCISNVVPRGLEPRTLRLLAVRSNQLSYETSGSIRHRHIASSRT